MLDEVNDPDESMKVAKLMSVFKKDDGIFPLYYRGMERSWRSG